MKRKSFWNAILRQAPDGGGGNPPPADPPADPPPNDTLPDLSFIPADYQTDGKPDLARFGEHYQELVSADAQRREAMGEVPEDGAYQFAVPGDLTFEGLDLPEGFAVELLTDDPAFQPLFGELSGFLKEIGAPKGAGPQVAGLLARYEATKESQSRAAWNEDMKTLGTPAQIGARVGAVQRKLESVIPADQAKALFSGERISAAGIKALEKLLAPRGTGAPPPQPNTPDLEGMSAYDRLKLANQNAGSRR